MTAHNSLQTQGAKLSHASLDNEIRQSVRGSLADLFDEQRRFIDRRIAELSMEISATVQLMDYSESNLTGQLHKIQDQIMSLITAPTNAARNSGLELEAVVQATEDAANTIMEAAEAIDQWVRESGTSGGSAGLQSVSDKINAIFEACSFQDLTSQRIRRAIEHLQSVETMLDGMLPGTEPKVAVPQHPPVAISPPGTETNPDLAQAAIDALMDF
jgi:chemotaxis protein CheZ